MIDGPRVAAVLLAAGASTRLGTPKQLVLLDGEALVARAARSALDAGGPRVIVVLGAHAAAIAPVLTGFPVTVVVNDDWSAGLASSLRVGVRAALVDPTIDGVLVTLADQPLVDATALRRLLTAFPGPHGVVASAYGDTVGVPAVFSRACASELTELAGDAGAGRWLRARGDAIVRVPVPEAAFDVDSADDVARLRATDSRRA